MLRVYNTLSNRKEEFMPDSGKIRMYVCGPTVYDLSHLGHARSAVAFDVIYRYLKYRGYEVFYTRNYTDIDDKIINRANKEGVSSQEIAERYIKAFDEDMEGLGVEVPTYRPKATETIHEIVGVIQALLDKDCAYIIDGDVYYSVRKFDGYGRLSGKNIEELEAGARVEVDERKRDPLDFALWKAGKHGEPWWESPWGRGRPGWHIECSAMSRKFLGETIDIHGGGRDLIFPHHENEIAQSEAATGKPFVRYWLHNGFVNIQKEKMSKSLGNILNIRDILHACPAEAVRLFLLSSHYRSPIDYSPEVLKEADAALDRFYATLERIERYLISVEVNGGSAGHTLRDKFETDMDDDFNSASVIGSVFNAIKEANRMLDDTDSGKSDPKKTASLLSGFREDFRTIGSVLGVFNKGSATYLEEKKRGISILPEEIEGFIRERNEARSKGDWEKADKIRIDLGERGIALEDYTGGTRWKVR
ncbi:MAG TPA: cysteine--tRNA ligase [Nitrospiria bacterium]|nr:cysteine--tRNA ligase [Nitrospiria bacterium]